MLPINPFIFFPAIIALLTSVIFGVASAQCDQSCGIGRTVPYPFGFSRSCLIQLNCSVSTGEIVIGDFLVRTITSDSLLIDLNAKCHRPIQSLSWLFNPNFAPTSRNAILLQNCTTSRSSPCELPAPIARSHFETHDCDYSMNSNISCYSKKKEGGGRFMDFGDLKETGCQSLFSSIFVESFNESDSAVSMEVQMVRLEWWLEGDCRCSQNANCTKLLSPVTGKYGFRCRCDVGFVGDGYRAGQGCRKVPSTCSPSKYLTDHCRGKNTFGVLIGGISVGASVMICFSLIYCFVRRRRSSFNTKTKTKWLISEATKGNCIIPFYTYKDIERATHGFAEHQRLGMGAYGTVYLGKICNNELVAIKRIRHRDMDSIEQVVNEIKLLSSVSHPNLVRLLGCSIEKSEQVLVYEFMPNGTLSQHLQRERSTGLALPTRLAIATETAQAIAHLHSADPPIYHRDIKSSNILLDYDFKSKVADFGLSRLGRTEMSHVSTAPQGTPGYLDPQYHQNFHLSDKSDVYSFGVVLVEIITALKVVDFSRPQNEVNLATLVTERIREGCLDELVDPFLERDACTASAVHKIAELAFRCLAFDQDTRPSMMEVAYELEQIRLNRWVCTVEDNSISTASLEASSNGCKEPVGDRVNKGGLVETRGLFAVQTSVKGCVSSMEEEDNSPVSVVQDPWISEESSPSTSCLLSNLIQ